MSRTDRTDLEIAALRDFIARASAGITGESDAGQIKALLGRLAGYAWVEQEHRVVYECLRLAHGRRVVPLREEMASEATRMGHPDVDWDLYFRPPRVDVDLAELVRRLTNNP